MGRDVPFRINNVCDGCGAIGAYDFMGDCYCQECCDKHQAEAEAGLVLAAKLDAECQALPAAKLLQDLLQYSRWSGDDFAINQPDDDDHARGSALEREVKRRLGVPAQDDF